MMITTALRWNCSNDSGESKEYEQEGGIAVLMGCRSCSAGKRA